ncbi:MAG: hypothetical protein R2705_14775 [Ilumatobacteraceae bacterium]
MSQHSVADHVVTAGAPIGAVLPTPTASELRLVDDEGTVLSHTEAVLAFVELIADGLTGDQDRPAGLTRTALPNWQRRTVAGGGDQDLGAGAHGRGLGTRGGVRGRRRADSSCRSSSPPSARSDGIGQMMDLLARDGRSLSEIRRGLPAVHVVRETVVTPWEQKGLVMRSLVEQAAGTATLVDGVKVQRDTGWVLALPDPEEPLTRVWAEGPTEEDARRLAQECTARIRALLR